MIDLESQVAAFQLQEVKSAKGTVENATEARLPSDSKLFLVEQVVHNTTGPSTLFASVLLEIGLRGMKCGSL